MSKLFNEKLSVRVKFDEARRLGRAKEGTARPILVMFVEGSSKVSVMRKSSTLKGTGIFVNNDLTPFQKRNQTFLIARLKKARSEGKSAFITNGKLISEDSKVASLDSLDTLSC